MPPVTRSAKRHKVDPSVSDAIGPGPFYKILNSDLVHYGFTYREGLNVDVWRFDPEKQCGPGGPLLFRYGALAFVPCSSDSSRGFLFLRHTSDHRVHGILRKQGLVVREFDIAAKHSGPFFATQLA